MTAFTLKLIAFLTMLIDHATACLVDVARIGNVSNTLYFTLRGIGRIAFPIFCFLIVEGAVHTKSKWRYALRILIFAFISEIPFDVALFGSFIKLSAQNVDFTLLIGLGVVCYMMWAATWKGKLCYLGLASTVLVVGAGALLAKFLCTDYLRDSLSQSYCLNREG